jgi:hypothetical protein
LLAHGRWFSSGTSASSTTKAGRHDIAEILLKVALNTKIQIQTYSARQIFTFPKQMVLLPCILLGAVLNQLLFLFKYFFLHIFMVIVTYNDIRTLFYIEVLNEMLLKKNKRKKRRYQYPS